MVQVDWLIKALSMHIQTLLRITKGNYTHRIGSFIISICLVDMNVFVGFDEIPLKTLQDIKETKCYRCYGWMDRRTERWMDNYSENRIPAHKHSLRVITSCIKYHRTSNRILFGFLYYKETEFQKISTKIFLFFRTDYIVRTAHQGEPDEHYGPENTPLTHGQEIYLNALIGVFI